MKRMKKKSGGASWMDTYGDMVTLLLCFFVLLYSMSNLDENKWVMVVQSFRRNAPELIVSVDGKGGEKPDADETPTVTPQDVQNAMNEIYEAIDEYLVQNNLEAQMSIVEGADYVFITFRDTVFFDGDSYVLLDPGKAMLDEIARAIAPQADMIDELRVMGHTSQGEPDVPNNPTFDRFLASNRSATVLVYLQDKNFINPAKLVNVGYGQWRSVAPFDTTENRAKNRRVELLITGIDPTGVENSIDKYYETREGRQS